MVKTTGDGATPSNEPQPMQLEHKRSSVTNVSINEKFNAMFTNDKSTVLNPHARGFISQHVSGSRNYNSAAYHNDYARTLEMCRDVCLGGC